MAKYKVVVHFEGAFNYVVSANSPEEAEEWAMDVSDSASSESFLENIADIFVADCWEIEEK